MLKIVREFAEQKLPPDDASLLAKRHANFYVSFAHEARPHLRDADQSEWLLRMGDEQDNLHAALRWSLDNAPATGLRMIHDLFFYWTIRGQWSDARKILAHAMEVARQQGDPAAQADIVMAAGVAARVEGDLQAGLRLAQESVDLWRTTGDNRGTAAALANLGIAEQALGRTDEAIATHTKALALLEHDEDAVAVSSVLTNLSTAYLVKGDLDKSRETAERALAMHEARGDRWAAGMALANLGDIACEAYDAYTAWRHYQRSIPALLGVGDLPHACHVLRQMAAVAAYVGSFASAAMIAGAATAFQSRTGKAPPGDEAQALAATIVAAKDGIRGEEFDAAWADGASLSPEEAAAIIAQLNLSP